MHLSFLQVFPWLSNFSTLNNISLCRYTMVNPFTYRAFWWLFQVLGSCQSECISLPPAVGILGVWAPVLGPFLKQAVPDRRSSVSCLRERLLNTWIKHITSLTSQPKSSSQALLTPASKEPWSCWINSSLLFSVSWAKQTYRRIDQLANLGLPRASKTVWSNRTATGNR